MRILVVEDDVRLQDSVAGLLRDAGYAVDSSEDGEESIGGPLVLFNTDGEFTTSPVRWHAAIIVSKPCLALDIQPPSLGPS